MSDAQHLLLFHPDPPTRWLKQVAAATQAAGIERLGELGFRLREVDPRSATTALTVATDAPAEYDHAWLNATRHPGEYALLVCDMDGTLIENECIDELAALLPATTARAIADCTAATMRGELPIEASLRQRVARLAGLPVRAIDDALERTIRVRAGTARLLRLARQAGWRTALVTGGFAQFAQPIARSLGFDHVLCNQLLVRDGALTGQFEGELVDATAKARAVAALAQTLGIAPQQTIALGDGANDTAMLAAAGLRIGVRPKPPVRAIAQHCIDFTSLDAVWHLAGG